MRNRVLFPPKRLWCIEYHTYEGHRRFQVETSEQRYLKAVEVISGNGDFITNTFITRTNWKGDDGENPE